MSDAFHLYALDHPQLARTLKGRLMKRKHELALQMADGYAQDFADYKHRAGVIAGISEAISMCDEIEKEERE